MRDEILACIYTALDEANEERGDEPPLPKAPETEIHGASGALDSLALINFIVAVEDGVSRELGVVVVLSDDRALAMDPSPFRTVAALADYTERLAREAS